MMREELRRDENIEGEVKVEVIIQRQFNKIGDEYGSNVWMYDGVIGQEDKDVICIKGYETMKCDEERYYFKLRDGRVVFVDLELDYISVL